LDSYVKKLKASVWIILISNMLGGIAFIIAYFLTKELLLLFGGIFVMIASVAFKYIMERFVLQKIGQLNNLKNNTTIN